MVCHSAWTLGQVERIPGLRTLKCHTGGSKSISFRDKLLIKPSESALITVAGVERNTEELPAVLPPDAPPPEPAQEAPGGPPSPPR